MNRRDRLLNEMQIPVWALRKPQALKGYARLVLDPRIKLVVICEQNWQASGLFQDVLRSLGLREQEYQWLSFEQSMRLNFEHKICFWLIQPEIQADRFREKYANQPFWWHSDWASLSNSAEKRRFWAQISAFSRQEEQNDH